MAERIVIVAQPFSDTDIERDFLRAINRDVRVQAVDNVAAVDTSHPITGIMLGADTLDEEDMDAMSGLDFVVKYGIGVDAIDVEAATTRGIDVANTPDYCTDEVSTHAIALLLACFRRIPQFNAKVKAGEWGLNGSHPVQRLNGQTLGLIGFGRIARNLVEKVNGFGLQVVAYDPMLDESDLASHGVEQAEFGEVLRRSDLLSIHAPLTNDTRQLFDSESFELMKETAILVNTSRGEIVDSDALEEALRTGEIASAGLDVLETEPPNNTDLVDFDKTIVTPHVGWYSEDSLVEIRRDAATAMAKLIQSDPDADHYRVN
jgi:D-3-phosphoglycerate dehydrogenase